VAPAARDLDVHENVLRKWIRELAADPQQAFPCQGVMKPGQYTSEHFQELLKAQGPTCSMSRAGEVWDNSAMESFFSSLKTERTARKVYRTREQARADVFDYIEKFYNPTRRHSTLGYVSPIQFEKAQEA
jgi:transposase InsO family protein